MMVEVEVGVDVVTAFCAAGLLASSSAEAPEDRSPRARRTSLSHRALFIQTYGRA